MAIIKHLADKLDQLPEKEPERVEVRPTNARRRVMTEGTSRKPPPKSVPSLEKVESIEQETSLKSSEKSEPMFVRPASQQNERMVVPIKSRNVQKPLSVVRISRPKAVALDDDERPMEPGPILPIPLKIIENSKLKMKIEKTQDVELIGEKSTENLLDEGNPILFGDSIKILDCPKDSNQVWIAVENSLIDTSVSRSVNKAANSASECMEICNDLMVFFHFFSEK